MNTRIISAITFAQRRVRRYPTLVQVIRAGRNLLHFGPWRSVALACRRLLSPPVDPPSGTTSIMLHSVDVPMMVGALERDGYFLGLQVQPEVVQESVPYWRDKKPGVYIDAHVHCPAIARIARDSNVLSAASSYFGCAVNMVECKVFISGENKPDALSTGFHFDHAGLRSLNVVVYLNDVDGDTGPHVFVAGTHRNKKFRDYLREMTSIAEIERRYPGRIITVTGNVGTVLLENAEVFHRRELAKQRRVALIVVYSTRGRRLLSIGKDLRPGSQATFRGERPRARV